MLSFVTVVLFAQKMFGKHTRVVCFTRVSNTPGNLLEFFCLLVPSLVEISRCLLRLI